MVVEDFFSSYTLEYKLTEERKVKILNDIKSRIIESKEQLESLNKIDFNHWHKNIDMDELIKIVEKYKNIEVQNRTCQKNIIIYYGNPYLTLHLCIQAFIYKKQLILETGEFMLGINVGIINMINSVLEENRLPKLLMHSIEINEKEKIAENNIKVIIIGAESKKWEYEGMCQYIPYNNYLAYCEDGTLIELKDTIYHYACVNLFEMEFLYEDNIEDVIEEMNARKGYICLILTRDKEIEKVAKEKIEARGLYINTNPFSLEEFNIDTKWLN